MGGSQHEDSFLLSYQLFTAETMLLIFSFRWPTYQASCVAMTLSSQLLCPLPPLTLSLHTG